MDGGPSCRKYAPHNLIYIKFTWLRILITSSSRISLSLLTQHLEFTDINPNVHQDYRLLDFLTQTDVAYDSYGSQQINIFTTTNLESWITWIFNNSLEVKFRCRKVFHSEILDITMTCEREVAPISSHL